MRKFLLLLVAVASVGMFSATVYASDDAEALIKSCEQQSQNASDMETAVNKCLDEKLQYDPND